jgi:hypothetical protein
MVDINRCMAGKNKAGQWHLACDTTGMPALGILQDMGYTHGTMSPPGVSYQAAAQFICNANGTSWTTNALNMYTTCAGIPTS